VQQAQAAGETLAATVPFVAVHCPSCAATKPRTYGVRGRMRWHRCQDCGLRFRSWELRPQQLRGWERSAPI